MSPLDREMEEVYVLFQLAMMMLKSKILMEPSCLISFALAFSFRVVGVVVEDDEEDELPPPPPPTS